VSKKLTSEQQIFIVQGLACMMSPTEVVEAVKDEFGITVTRQQVWNYDPKNGQSIAADLVDIFNKTREAWEKESISVRIANRAHRLNRLDRLAVKAERARNLPLAAQLLEQAAKECGGAYTNKQHIEGKVTAEVTTTTMTVEQWKQRREERVNQAKASMALFEEPVEAEAPPDDSSRPRFHMLPVVSSNVALIGYHESTNTAAVRFKNGKLYHVSPVEQETFTQFYNAPSKGRFYNEHFKDVEGVTVTPVPEGDAGE
jgi:hypothetical protein